MLLTTAAMCLALNIYHEARGEDLVGQQAVALVTMNRARWQEKQVCKEVYKPSQFSWTLKPKGEPVEGETWRQAVVVANQVLGGQVVDFTGGATHYHTHAVKPEWRKRLQFVMALGNHRFYRIG